jgi:hypothetical protein
MSTYRHDSIQLNDANKEEEFRAFVLNELFPFFKKTYGKSTRITRSVLVDQMLLEDAKKDNKYTWQNIWTGVTDDPVFKDALMGGSSGTEAILNKLDGYGKREVTGMWESVTESG